MLVMITLKSSDLASNGQKVDAHAISIKHLELQMSQLSLTVNPRQSGTLPSNTVQNPKNDGHCMSIGKQTIDPPMPSSVENVIRGDVVRQETKRRKELP